MRVDLRERRELVSGFSDSLSRAIEFVAVPLLLAFAGHKLDGALGTGNTLLVALAVFGVVGMVLRAWYAYVAAMTEAEQDAPWRRR